MKRANTGLFVLSFVLSCAAFTFAQGDLPREIKGGILNGKAISLPKPVYSDEAKAAGIEGAVQVDVLISESGDVISADVPVSRAAKVTRGSDGKTENIEMEPVNPLLADSARQAALAAKFSPTLLDGVPVRVKGTIVYNFVAGKHRTATNGIQGMNGGVLNGKALSLPAPAFPAAARAVAASGTVSVQVVIDESGAVSEAQAVSGHPLLRAAAVEAARAARFSPTLLSGTPVKISGVIVYNFVLPDGGRKQ